MGGGAFILGSEGAGGHFFKETEQAFFLETEQERRNKTSSRADGDPSLVFTFYSSSVVVLYTYHSTLLINIIIIIIIYIIHDTSFIKIIQEVPTVYRTRMMYGMIHCDI